MFHDSVGVFDAALALNWRPVDWPLNVVAKGAGATENSQLCGIVLRPAFLAFVARLGRRHGSESDREDLLERVEWMHNPSKPP